MSTIAEEFEKAARTLRSSPPGGPEHTEVLTTVTSWMDKHAAEARDHGYNDRWDGYDEPGHAKELRALARRVLACTPDTVAPRPCRFALVRKVDHTGVSGTGHVADGVVWPDGTVAIRWRGPRASTVVRANLDDTKKIHGHGGDTGIQWIDPEPESAPVQLGGEAL